MPSEDLSDEEILELTKKQLRKKLPSGWMELARYETNALLIDALLEAPPNREFTAKELADESGASKKSIENRIHGLVEMGVVIELPDRDRSRYQLNEYSPIVRKIYELNTTVEQVKNGNLPESVNPPSDHRKVPQKGNIRGLSDQTHGSSGSTIPGVE